MAENSKDDPIWTYETMTYNGAVTLAKTVRDKMGCKLLEKPIQRDDGMWVIMFSNPFMSVEEG